MTKKENQLLQNENREQSNQILASWNKHMKNDKLQRQICKIIKEAESEKIANQGNNCKANYGTC